MKGAEMEVHSEIEACRTCGIFFLTSSNLLRHLFQNEPEIVMVRQELQANPSWKMQLSENDAFPKYICTICLLEFHRIFKFQTTVIQTQQQLQQLYNLQQENIQKIKIKTEIGEEPTTIKREPPPAATKSLPDDEPNVCGFIYVDDLSDDEYDESHEGRNITPFKVPHIPIKDEIFEEAHIPKTDESLAPEMSVLALTQTVKKTTTSPHDNVQPKQEIDDDTDGASAVTIPCNLCLHVSTDQQQHRQHLLRVHETKPVECHICGKQFPPGTTDTRLKYHMKWHRINKHIKCSQCGFHCPSREVLNEHMRAVHTKTPCKLCGKLFLPRKMRMHLQKQHKSDSLQKLDCPYCASYFTTSDERSQHISLFHNVSNDQLTMSSFNLNTEAVAQNVTFLDQLQTETTEEAPSSSCETTSTTILSTSSSEMSHTNDVIADEAYEGDASTAQDAEESTDLFVQAEEKDTETVEEASADESMKFDCAQCPESFTRIDLLIAHSQVHAQAEKPKGFECNVCGKSFDLKFSLNRHMKKHKNTTL